MRDFNKWPARSKIGYADTDHSTMSFDPAQKQLLNLVSTFTAKERKSDSSGRYGSNPLLPSLATGPSRSTASNLGASQQIGASRRQRISLKGSVIGSRTGTKQATQFRANGANIRQRWRCVSKAGGVLFRNSPQLSDKVDKGIAYGHEVSAMQRLPNWLQTTDGYWVPINMPGQPDALFELAVTYM